VARLLGEQHENGRAHVAALAAAPRPASRAELGSEAARAKASGAKPGPATAGTKALVTRVKVVVVAALAAVLRVFHDVSFRRHGHDISRNSRLSTLASAFCRDAQVAFAREATRMYRQRERAP